VSAQTNKNNSLKIISYIFCFSLEVTVGPRPASQRPVGERADGGFPVPPLCREKMQFIRHMDKAYPRATDISFAGKRSGQNVKIRSG
jgi:hypothetical protein